MLFRSKGVATLGLGLVGWAATSGSKAERQKMLIPAKIKVLPEGVVIEAELENPIRIPFNKIVKTSQTLNTIIIHLINGQNIYIERCRDYNEVNYLINEGACGEEKDLWNELEDENINNQNIISSVEELEKVMNMYEKGLITDEEFSIMKKKIIEK